MCNFLRIPCSYSQHVLVELNHLQGHHIQVLLLASLVFIVDTYLKEINSSIYVNKLQIKIPYNMLCIKEKNFRKDIYN